MWQQNKEKERKKGRKEWNLTESKWGVSTYLGQTKAREFSSESMQAKILSQDPVTVFPSGSSLNTSLLDTYQALELSRKKAGPAYLKSDWLRNSEVPSRAPPHALPVAD